MVEVKDLMTLTPRTLIKKGWGDKDFVFPGVGEVFVYHGPQENEQSFMIVETVKVMYIASGKKLSYHFHISKKEIFFIASGRVKLTFGTNTLIDDRQSINLKEGDCVLIPPGLIHSLENEKDEYETTAIIVEVSTLDKPEDSIRLIKGD